MFTGLIPCVTIFQADMYLMQTQHLSLKHISAQNVRMKWGVAWAWHMFLCVYLLGSMQFSLTNPLTWIDTLIFNFKSIPIPKKMIYDEFKTLLSCFKMMYTQDLRMHSIIWIDRQPSYPTFHAPMAINHPVSWYLLWGMTHFTLNRKKQVFHVIL